MIHFTGTTNKDYVMINLIQCKDKNGNKFAIDRDATEYKIDNNQLDMTWHNCYFWDDNGAIYLTDEDYENLQDAVITDIEIEDDADVDYQVTITEFST